MTLGSDGKVTSSTGDIQIAAGRDFSAASPASVVYTTGRAVALPILSQAPLKYDAPAAGVNFVDGGSISISAKGNVSGSGGYADINDWLRRTTDSRRVRVIFADLSLVAPPTCRPTGGWTGWQ